VLEGIESCKLDSAYLIHQSPIENTSEHPTEANVVGPSSLQSIQPFKTAGLCELSNGLLT
jgi:hypothetical protein